MIKVHKVRGDTLISLLVKRAIIYVVVELLASVICSLHASHPIITHTMKNISDKGLNLSLKVLICTPRAILSIFVTVCVLCLLSPSILANF